MCVECACGRCLECERVTVYNGMGAVQGGARAFWESESIENRTRIQLTARVREGLRHVRVQAGLCPEYASERAAHHCGESRKQGMQSG